MKPWPNQQCRYFGNPAIFESPFIAKLLRFLSSESLYFHEILKCAFKLSFNPLWFDDYFRNCGKGCENLIEHCSGSTSFLKIQKMSTNMSNIQVTEHYHPFFLKNYLNHSKFSHTWKITMPSVKIVLWHTFDMDFQFLVLWSQQYNRSIK